MSKTPDKSADAPNGRSKLKLALFAIVPLLAGGGGLYAGWTMVLGGDAVAAVDPHAPDPVKVSAVPTEIAAETSFTHSFALGTIIARECGAARMVALKTASDEEAAADGMLATLSWQAAARRTAVIDEQTCRRFRYEIGLANAKAEALAEARSAHPDRTAH